MSSFYVYLELIRIVGFCDFMSPEEEGNCNPPENMHYDLSSCIPLVDFHQKKTQLKQNILSSQETNYNALSDKYNSRKKKANIEAISFDQPVCN